MHERHVVTSAGRVVVTVEHGLGRSPAGWRVAPADHEPWLAGLTGAIGASEDSAVDNFWVAAESLLRTARKSRAG